ncbi:thiamine-phosphate diphosphorylase [Scopulibacillus darangshiensis]|uniref:Thiamine-phosphate diphosphorylase n=1 Tax=Scopulibacillus darangshiensis TaxID=442528 RepID=A0A4R2PAT3_9BACL|nr:thiamine phosphate synthase [Scopulibacillus darangshiensis]TCP32067.1 thiamine-phosphate diphosphorylase [Scopulibacillus darangshiensis]
MSECHILSTGNQTIEKITQIINPLIHNITAFHLREKHRSETELNMWVDHLIASGIPKEKIVVNTYYNLAGKMGIRGVHLPENGPPPHIIKQLYPELIVGCSVHSGQSAREKISLGPDYVMYGNIFPTKCKPGLKGRGLRELAEMAKIAPVPVIAVGGMSPLNTQDVLQHGASGIAVMSGVMEAERPMEMCRQYVNQLKEVKYNGKKV